MTTKPCTACKHHKQGHICGLTGHTTSKTRAYKTDKDDCFSKDWVRYWHDNRIDPLRRCKTVPIFTETLDEAFENGVAAIDLRDGNLFKIKAKDIRKNLTDFIEQNEK